MTTLRVRLVTMTTFALGLSESTAISASRSGRGEVDLPLSDILILGGLGRFERRAVLEIGIRMFALKRLRKTIS